jgi:hypothetical protein
MPLYADGPMGEAPCRQAARMFTRGISFLANMKLILPATSHRRARLYARSHDRAKAIKPWTDAYTPAHAPTSKAFRLGELPSRGHMTVTDLLRLGSDLAIASCR